jgi:hypothetical protein
MIEVWFYIYIAIETVYHHVFPTMVYYLDAGRKAKGPISDGLKSPKLSQNKPFFII